MRRAIPTSLRGNCISSTGILGLPPTAAPCGVPSTEDFANHCAMLSTPRGDLRKGSAFVIGVSLQRGTLTTPHLFPGRQVADALPRSLGKPWPVEVGNPTVERHGLMTGDIGGGATIGGDATMHLAVCASSGSRRLPHIRGARKTGRGIDLSNVTFCSTAPKSSCGSSR